MEVPTTEIDGEIWFLLKKLGKKIVFRADKIKNNKMRVKDSSGHRMDEAVAEGSVKCKSKTYDISQFCT